MVLFSFANCQNFPGLDLSPAQGWAKLAPNMKFATLQLILFDLGLLQLVSRSNSAGWSGSCNLPGLARGKSWLSTSLGTRQHILSIYIILGLLWGVEFEKSFRPLYRPVLESGFEVLDLDGSFQYIVLGYFWENWPLFGPVLTNS